MQVTSDCLFHFTDSFKHLESILTSKFKMTYCQETFELCGLTNTNYIPMISFCDIPLSLAKDQIAKYGSYAIGLSKSWGIKNKLNPLLYVEKNSILASHISGHLDSVLDTNKHLFQLLEMTKGKPTLRSIKGLFDNYKEAVTHSLSLHRCIKNYEGDLIRKGKTFKNYRFYDEREWRYVPLLKYGEKVGITKKEFLKYRNQAKVKPLINGFTLQFTSSDIKYLLVKNTNDIPKLIKLIKSLANLTNSPDDADILSTKILTVEQINADF